MQSQSCPFPCHAQSPSSIVLHGRYWLRPSCHDKLNTCLHAFFAVGLDAALLQYFATRHISPQIFFGVSTFFARFSLSLACVFPAFPSRPPLSYFFDLLLIAISFGGVVWQSYDIVYASVLLNACIGLSLSLSLLSLSCCLFPPLSSFLSQTAY